MLLATPSGCHHIRECFNAEHGDIRSIGFRPSESRTCADDGMYDLDEYCSVQQLTTQLNRIAKKLYRPTVIYLDDNRQAVIDITYYMAVESLQNILSEEIENTDGLLHGLNPFCKNAIEIRFRELLRIVYLTNPTVYYCRLRPHPDNINLFLLYRDGDGRANWDLLKEDVDDQTVVISSAEHVSDNRDRKTHRLIDRIFYSTELSAVMLCVPKRLGQEFP